MEELLILVDEDDVELGYLDKWNVHKIGLLHRAFSVFIFNSKGELLLQQRSDEKYHSPGVWTNTCCSHPLKGEILESAIFRRLEQELGMQCPVTFQFKFQYKSHFENDLVEHEIDHVYFGWSDQQPKINPAEIKDWRYISLDNLKLEMEQYPDNFSTWIRICFPQIEASIKLHNN
ncbi:isopentenyl-diphosphate Delta-isomerase [Pedobacter flavus]|uniref:Isopentenyl-diphosphate delta-isomerase n=1 Tax=Pedobacter flavus TaxID=3113906 RepID=A0ABU7H333_9SPHI|nr:isopentenyl-diphosphate Delta-isomerase [Pedobacter sp. VNH31]MEE1885729.1 isopentenyl-diphosphate Delta-isomerase [Pedobacter sp. VNH31]